MHLERACEAWCGADMYVTGGDGLPSFDTSRWRPGIAAAAAEAR
jgi:hypothetical protein